MIIKIILEAGKNLIFSGFYRPVWACNLHPSVIFYRVVILIFPYFAHTRCQLLQLLHRGGLLSSLPTLEPGLVKIYFHRGLEYFIVKYCVTPNNIRWMAHCLRHVSSVWLLADKVEILSAGPDGWYLSGKLSNKTNFSFSVITSPSTPCRLINIMNKYDYC